MSIAYERSVTPPDMQDGRRRAWAVPGKPGHFTVINRKGDKRYGVEVVGGMPLCSCTAAGFGRACWHAALVLDRITREPALAGAA